MKKDTRCLWETRFHNFEKLGPDRERGPYLSTTIFYRDWDYVPELSKNVSSRLKFLRVKLENWEKGSACFNSRALVDKVDESLPAGTIGGPALVFDATLFSPKYKTDYLVFNKQEDTCTDQPNSAVFVKAASCIDWVDPAVCEQHRAWIEVEVRFMETLSRSPHPHVVAYHGCVVENGYIVGIALEKCTKTLEERCQDTTTPFNVSACLSQIAAALAHLHDLGYCHNDIKPGNIMVRADDTAVLIDFDSCLPVEELLSKGKGQTPGWYDTMATTSNVKNDWLGLAKVEDFLRKNSSVDKSSAVKHGGGGGGGGDGGGGGGVGGGGGGGNSSASGGGGDDPAASA